MCTCIYAKNIKSENDLSQEKSSEQFKSTVSKNVLRIQTFAQKPVLRLNVVIKKWEAIDNISNIYI